MIAAFFFAACPVPSAQGDEVSRLSALAFELSARDEASALDSADRAVEAGPGRADALRARSFVSLRLRDLEGAVRFGLRALEADPANPFVRLWLGNAAFWRGDLDEADRRYGEALARVGDEATAADVRSKMALVAGERAYRAKSAALVRRSLIAGGATLFLLAAGAAAALLFSRRRRGVEVSERTAAARERGRG